MDSKPNFKEEQCDLEMLADGMKHSAMECNDCATHNDHMKIKIEVKEEKEDDCWENMTTAEVNQQSELNSSFFPVLLVNKKDTISPTTSTTQKRGGPRTCSPKKKYSKVGQGSALRGQARELVCTLREYFEKEREHGGPLIDVNKVVKRTAAALKLNKNTVIKIGKEKQKEEEELEKAGRENGEQIAMISKSILETPGKRRLFKKRVTDLDPFQLEAIRQHVYQYYMSKEYPTLKKLLVSLKEEKLFEGSQSSLRTIMQNLGFEFQVLNTRAVLLERTDIVACRCRYLRKMKKVDFSTVVWVSESWISAGHTLKKNWTDGTAKKAPLGGVIVLHAGTSHGFVPNCLLMFCSKRTVVDYHEEITSDTFKKWFENSLIPNIPPNSTIIMGNVPYNSTMLDKPPTMQNRRRDILAWLEGQVLAKLAEDTRKVELMELVTLRKPRNPVYIIDELAKRNGHHVIRLPPYHAHFNPIENIWAQVKDFVAQNNKKFTIAEVEQLAREGVETVTAQNWSNVVSSVEALTEEQWHRDGVVEDCVEEMVISVTSSSSSSDGEEFDSDSSLDIDPLSV